MPICDGPIEIEMLPQARGLPAELVVLVEMVPSLRPACVGPLATAVAAQLLQSAGGCSAAAALASGIASAKVVQAAVAALSSAAAAGENGVYA